MGTQGKRMVGFVPILSTGKCDFQKFAAKEAMELSTWLDWQCKGGWEVFEIKRDFETNNTWCLFRKLVD